MIRGMEAVRRPENGQARSGSDRMRLPRLILAPMAGYTDAPMRRICGAMGAGWTFTEMTDAAGIVRDSPRSLQLLDTLPGEAPVAAHLFGAEPALLAEAAARVEAMGRFAAIDLNAGCPVRRILAKRAGAALMQDPDRLYAILHAMRRAVRLPLMLKTRMAIDAQRRPFAAIVEAAVAAGVDALTIHARPVSRGHAGPADVAGLAAVREICPLPLIGNGGIRAPGDARLMFEVAGVDAVMVGRAAMGNPWVFGQLQAGLDGQTPSQPTVQARLRMLDRHLVLQTRFARRQARRHDPAARRLAPETAAVMRFRAHLFRYLSGMRGAPRVRAELNAMRSIADVRRSIREHVAEGTTP